MPLKVSDGIGAWIKDFQKSDAPQFKGKSKDERRDQAVAAYLSAKRGDQKEGIMPNYADKMKKKMMTPSDKDKLLKIRQMLDKEKKPVKKETVVRSADKRPEVYTKPDGKRGVRMVPVDKQVVKTEAMTPAQKAAHDKAVADFKKRGGKITKLPPGKAAGYHGKDDPGSGIKGMLAKGTGTKYNIRNRGKHLDKDMNESMLGHNDADKLNGGKSKDPNFRSPGAHIDYHHRRSGGHEKYSDVGAQDRHRYQVAKKLGYKVESYNHMNEDFMFKVGVEGLPDMIIGGSSPGDIKARLRKIVKQPSMITSVSRMTSAEVKKRYRDMAQGKEDTNEAVKPTKAMHVFNNEKDARAKAKEIGGRYVKGSGKSAGKHAAIKEDPAHYAAIARNNARKQAERDRADPEGAKRREKAKAAIRKKFDKNPVRPADIGRHSSQGGGFIGRRNESVLEKHVYRFATKTKQGNIHHPSKDEAGAKKAIEKRTGEKVQSMTYRGPVSSMPKRRVREMVDPMDLRGRPKKRDPYDGKTKYGMKHPLHPLNIQKRKEKEKLKKMEK